MNRIRLTAVSSRLGVIACLATAITAHAANVPFTEQVVSTTADGPRDVVAADVDGDGDADILSVSFADGKIAWYENDGADPPVFTERVITLTADGAESLFAADLDGDTDVDVLFAAILDDKIAWYENDGGSPPSFTERVISLTAMGARDVFAADVDGDGNIDVLSASNQDDKIAWYKSDGAAPPTFTEHVISNTAVGAFSLFAADLDGDGDTDVVCAADTPGPIGVGGAVTWYENNGAMMPTFAERVILATTDNPIAVFAADVDGDGDTDVLSARTFDHKIAWHENDGAMPPTFTERIISTAANAPASVYATDVDGDGDIDVLSASILDDKIAWYDNNGALVPNFTERIISTNAIGAFAVSAGDVDGDGFTDVLSASFSDGKIAWYENGSPPSGIPTVSQWGLVAMSLLVLTAGTLVHERRRVAA